LIGGPFSFQKTEYEIMNSHFIERMTRHFGSKPCPKGLAASWHQLEQGLAAATAQHQWQAIQWPTGSGKTEALTVLCATPEVTKHPGALVVTKFTAEADEVASKVNALAGATVAVASHQKAPMAARTMSESPVLVVTHEAYRSALREACDKLDTSTKLDLYHRYWHDDRRWIIVDEAFNWVDAYEVDLDDAAAMCAALTVQMQPDANLGHLSTFIHQLAKGHSTTRSDGLLCDEHFGLLASIDTEQLRAAIKDVPTETIELWRNIELHSRANEIASLGTNIRHATFKNEYVALLNRLDAIKRIGRCWISQRKQRMRLHSSRLLLDTNRPCGVILDATASIDRAYDVLGDRVAIMPRPERIRSYKNVTVHVSRPHHVGKQYLAKHAATEWPTVVKQLNPRLSNQSDVLVVTQKNTKDYIKPALSCRTQLIGHWGDLDGKNDWNQCNAVLIYGLPYPDDIALTDVFHACTDLWSDDWFTGKREHSGCADVKAALKYGFIARSVIQAICRVRCRTIIDDDGNCAHTDVFILLPRGTVGDVLLEAIRSQMPGAKIAQWNALPEDRQSPTRNELKLVAELRRAMPGIYTATHCIKQLSITRRTFERMTANLRKPGSIVMQELVAMGAAFHCPKGRGQEAHFIKH
jgi:hypothetical protein